MTTLPVVKTDVGVGPRCWRDAGIRSRLSFALQQDGFQKDVTFVVGDSAVVISAHRLILSLSSEYLDKLMRDGGGGLINLPRVDPCMFKRLLKFIYTDEIEHDNFLAFLDFAKTFGFHHLGQICLESVQKTGITVENVVFILSLEGRQKQERSGDEVVGEEQNSELRRNCLQFINRNADLVVRRDSFNEISQPDLACVLESDDFILEGGEFAVFLVALRWAKYQCKAGGRVADTPGNFKTVLGNARFKIRYTLIPYPKLLSDVKLSRLLTPLEFVQVLKAFIDPTENTLGISTLPRNSETGTPLQLSQEQGIPKMIENENSEPKPKRVRNLSPNKTKLNLPPQSLLPMPSYLPFSSAQAVSLPPAENDLATVSDPSSGNCHDSLTRAPYLKIVTPYAESLSLVLHKQLPTTPSTSTASITNGIEEIPVAMDHQINFTSQDFEPLSQSNAISQVHALHPVSESVSHEPGETQIATAEIHQPQPLGNSSSPETSVIASVHEPMVIDSSPIVPDSVSPSFPTPDQSSYSSSDFVVSNSILNWGRLISRIENVQSTLTSIVLNNTTLVGFNKTGNRVILPHLEIFHYSVDRDHVSTNINPTLPDKSHPYFVNMKGFLFFEKSSSTPWLFSTLPSLGVDIRVIEKGIKLMDICPSEKKILLSYPPPTEGDAILENCPTNTKILSLCCAGIKSPDRIPTNSLEQLNLYNVEINGMTTTRFVNKCPALKQLSLLEFYDNPGRLSPLFLSSCLQKCRTTLKSLSLSKFTVSGPSQKHLRNFVPFSAMESLYLNCCDWNALFPKHLGKSFPNLKRFGIRWAWKDKAKTCALLKDVLNQLRILEVLVISLRNSIDFEEGEGDIYNLNPTEEESWIQDFLMDATPTPVDTAPAPVPDGYVVEDLLSQNIVLKKVGGVWKRAGTGNNDAAAVEQMHYQALKLNQFFEDVGMIKYLI